VAAPAGNATTTAAVASDTTPAATKPTFVALSLVIKLFS